jgi:hypothetical protein
MIKLELPNGTHMDFENTEAFELALQRIRESKPIVVRDVKDGGPEVLWAPEDDVDARFRLADTSSSEGEGDGRCKGATSRNSIYCHDVTYWRASFRGLVRP